MKSAAGVLSGMELLPLLPERVRTAYDSARERVAAALPDAADREVDE
jgi:hypothetical protein